MKSQRIYGMGWLAAYVGFVTVVSFIVAVAIHPLPAISVFLGPLVTINLLGWEDIPADPPNRALLKYFGKRVPRVIDEGWRFLFPGVYTRVLVPFEVWTLVLPDQLVRTPDMGEVSVPVTVIAQVDAGEGISMEERGRALVRYEDAKGEEGVKRIITAKVGPALRQWGMSLPDVEIDADTGETRTAIWEDALSAGPQAARRIAEKICGKSLTVSDIEQFETDNGFLRMTDRGTRILGVEVGEIEPTGDLAKSAEQAAKERRDRIAETVELKHIRDRVVELMADGFTLEQATELIQTERGKVVKNIDLKQFGIPPESRGIVEGALVAILGSRKRRWPWQS